MSDQSPNPYGQPSSYGQPSPYGQQPSYGTPQTRGERRPGTVTAAAWITIVFSAVTAALFGFTGLALLVARDQVITEMERVPEFQDANIDPDAAVGVLVAVMVGLVVWCLIAIVLAVMVLRRSNVARILLVISAAVTVVFSLLGVASGVSVLPLVAGLATIVLLFTGGAGDWFKRVGPGGGYPGSPTGYAGDQYGGSYGSQHDSQYGGSYGEQPSDRSDRPGPDAAPQYPSTDNPYGQPSGPNPYGQQPPTGPDNPYGQPQRPAEGGTDYPPRNDSDR
jgi:hypothetical protein